MLHGVLLVDKPSGLTSHDVVARIRRALKTKEVGHCGTLDPIASGLLVILVGHGTKLSDYILGGEKKYRVRIQLGVETDTLDRTGQILHQHENPLSPETLSAEVLLRALQDLEGTHELPIPAYSAAKVGGRKLYEYARNGEAVPQPLKKMTFSQVRWVGGQVPLVDVELWTAKGGFIRSFAAELGLRLGTGAMVSELRRIESTPYKVEDALQLEEIEDRADSAAEGRFGPSWIPLSQALPGWRTYSVKAREEFLLRNGQISHDLANRMMGEQKRAIAAQAMVGIKVLNEGGQLLGLLEAAPGQGLKIRRILSTPAP